MHSELESSKSTPTKQRPLAGVRATAKVIRVEKHSSKFLVVHREFVEVSGRRRKLEKPVDVNTEN